MVPAKSNKTIKDQVGDAAKGSSALLSQDERENLAGFFDVLIQMDLELQQRNEKRSNDEITTESHK